ncbi:MAG: hypothetical protein M3271_07825, partial [Actinomycetota bacterium]|nr:hypothetical protein [Actinomycetota bacterium]
LQGGTAVPPPLAASGIRPGAVLWALFAIALAVAGFVGRDRIADAFDSARGAVEDAADEFDQDPAEPPGGGGGGGGGNAGGGGGNGGGGGGSGGGSGVEIAYRHVPEVVRDIRAGGIPCTGTTVDSSDEFVETGSCQSNGMHVQINLYFQPAGIEFAKEFYREFVFASVHADNWWVSGDEALMRRIRQALGGRLQPAAF